VQALFRLQCKKYEKIAQLFLTAADTLHRDSTETVEMSGINDIKSSLPPNFGTATNVAGDKRSAGSNSAETSTATDKVSLTDTATQLQSLQQKISDAPEVNEQRVADIKAAIADGSYNVDSQKLARNMIDFEGNF
jgi:negative regulator of flagellin synthesis FlgM